MTKLKILWPLIWIMTIFILTAIGCVNAVIEIRAETINITPIEYIKDELDEWIDNLGRHEGCATKMVNGKLVGTMDSGSYSYGPLCFKEGTFIGYVRQFDLLPYATDEEIMNWIGDVPFQKQLARLMIEDNWNNWRHWKTTTLYKIGYPPKI